MSVDTIKIGSAIPEIIEIDDIAEDFFDFPKPEKVLIVEGITDKEVLDNYLYLKRIKVDFSIRSANMIEGNSYSGKDWALQYYDRNKSNQEIKVLLDRDYDYICSSQREDEGIFYYDYYELENYFFEDKILKSILIPNCQVKCNKVIPLIKRVFFQLFELAQTAFLRTDSYEFALVFR